MTKVYKADKIEKALSKKGFERHNDDHRRWILYVDGKRTAIGTEISHGRFEYQRRLLAHLRRQLGDLSGDEFDRLVSCTLDGPGYRKLLEGRGLIP